MGANLSARDGDRLPPVVVRGGPLRGTRHVLEVASAQVKSAILLAGLVGGAAVRVREPGLSRDHTERLLQSVGVQLRCGAVADGWQIELAAPPERLWPFDFAVPGDISSAAFVLAFAVLGGVGGELEVERVGLNPTRTAFLDVLDRMGASVRTEVDKSAWGVEPVGTVRVGPAPLRGVRVGKEEVPGLIDELPMIAALGARAEGVTSISGAEELRAKESDRIAAMVENLRALGVRAEERPDGLDVEGSDRPLRGRIRTRGDHRVAMAFGVLGAIDGNDIEVDDRGAADVSFPGFWSLLDRLVARSPV
jgi:3-phosphoshikimate 1-carboxyvinyltransferase